MILWTVLAMLALVAPGRAESQERPGEPGRSDLFRGSYAYASGDLASAESFYRRALSEFQSIGDELGEAESRMELGRIFVDRFELQGAEKHFESALEIRRRRLGSQHEGTAEVYHSLGIIALYRGELEHAQSLHEKALEIAIQALGPRHSDVGTALRSLGQVLEARGEFKRAQSLYEEAIDVLSETLGDHWRVAETRALWAKQQILQGQPEKARQELVRALAVFERDLGPRHFQTLGVVFTLGQVLARQNEPRQALLHFNRAAMVGLEVLGPGHPLIADIFHEQALVFQRLGRVEDAKELLSNVIVAKERLYSLHHPKTLDAIYGLATLLHGAGDISTARRIYERALELAEEVLDDESVHLANLMGDASLLRLEAGETERGLELIERSLAIQGNLISSFLGEGSERDLRLLLRQHYADLPVFAHLQKAPNSEKAARLAFEAVLQRKGIELDVILAGPREGPLTDPETRRLFEELRRLRSQRTRLWTRPIPGLDASARSRELEAVKLEIDQIEAQLQSLHSSVPPGLQRISVVDVQSRLRPREALIEFYVYALLEPGAMLGQPQLPKLRYAAGVLSKGGSPVWVDMGSAEDMEWRAVEFRDSLMTLAPDVRQKGRALFDVTLGKLKPFLADVDHLVISPNGTLQIVPFAALIDDEEKFVLESFTISYVATGRELIRRGEPSPFDSAGVVLVGGIDFGSEDSARGSFVQEAPPIDYSGLRFASLPATRAEVDAIADTFDSKDPNVVRVLRRSGADESTLKGLRRPMILHLATHGFFLPAEGESSWRGEGGVAEPLLRSGLVLAGANRLHRSSQIDDGFLTALEILDLDLRGTELVVLSACETGLGEISYNEAVYGLRRALTYAGAKTQMMSLWQVSDESTKDLMVAWYQEMKLGHGRADALRRAQLAFLRGESSPRAREPSSTRGAEVYSSLGFTHPYYWASFIVLGETGPLAFPAARDHSEPAVTSSRHEAGDREAGL